MENKTRKGRSLLMALMMIASAIVPSMSAAVADTTGTATQGPQIDIDMEIDLWNDTMEEGDMSHYEVSLNEAPDGVLVITPVSDNTAVTLDPSYLKFTKLNWDTTQVVYVHTTADVDGNNTNAVITHTISGDDSVFGADSFDCSMSVTTAPSLCWSMIST